MIRLLCLAALLHLSRSVPNGFIDEGITDQIAITGDFAPNPRNEGKPMLLLSSKEGTVRVLEDPDNNDDNTVIAEFGSILCANGERGLQTIRPHPDFAKNRWLFVYYTSYREGCLEDVTLGPHNRLSRFTMSATSLMVDMTSEVVLIQTSPAPKRVHNGGSIQFGNDGKIWLTIGDGGSRKPPVSQDDGILYGSLLRLNHDGSIPDDNPFVADGIRCGNSGGIAPKGKVCSEIYATGLRNPFRLVIDPNTKDKVKFHVGDVGASAWEEVSVGGTDYPGVNYGWPPKEGPCDRGRNVNCAVEDMYQDPFYYYEHTQQSEGGAFTGSAFVPAGIWPPEYQYMFIDFVFHKIYNLIEDPDREERSESPPIPGYRNETFHAHPFMVDMFFGPYKGGNALYYVARSDGQNVRRIRYTGTVNKAPVAVLVASATEVAIGVVISFTGSDSSDPDGDDLDYFWEFGDGDTSTAGNPDHSFDQKGEYTVTLTVTDQFGQTNQQYAELTVGDRPTAQMTSPAVGDKFFVGQVIQLQGSAVDADGNDLDSSQLSWEVRQHHAEHFHPFLDKTSGNGFSLFPAPEPEDFNAATNSYLEIIMYAADNDGLTTTISRQIYPKLVMVDVVSNHPVQVLIDEFPINTPATITSWENHQLRLDAVDQWPYVFSAWGDEGTRQHSILIPAATALNPLVVGSFNKILLSYDPIIFIPTVRLCSPPEPCDQCQGHCDDDADCVGELKCFKKGGKGLSVPGCLGIDNSNTDWCTLLKGSTPTAPTASPTTSAPVTFAPIVAPVGLPGPVAPTTPMPVVLPMSLAPVIGYTDADDAPDTPRPTTQYLPLKETEDAPTLGDSSASMMAWGSAAHTTVAAMLVALFL